MALIQSLKWCLINRIAGKPPPTKNAVDSAGLALFEEQALRVSQGKKPPPVRAGGYPGGLSQSTPDHGRRLAGDGVDSVAEVVPDKPNRRQAASHKNGVDPAGRVLFEEQELRVSQGEKRFQYAKAVIQEVFR
ncbi:hypothetical protein N015_06615 [Pseudomonas asturiensis]|uniref:Uncharacterized protein n=1 Tax=Pseudomonas asturiensis TaxID=1190415 RepID=A0ABX6H9J9_9PSED|nr:hypothetical protein [Pseudomonas asturiensis]QHF02099.1 hypothetical protein N015_06615 [Pseudomonas asturiensis]